MTVGRFGVDQKILEEVWLVGSRILVDAAQPNQPRARLAERGTDMPCATLVGPPQDGLHHPSRSEITRQIVAHRARREAWRLVVRTRHCEAGRRLCKPLPTATAAPWTVMAVAIYRDVDGARSKRRDVSDAEPAPRERAGSVTLGEHVGLASEFVEQGAGGRVVEIKPRGALPVAGINLERLAIGTFGRCDPEHVGTMLG